MSHAVATLALSVVLALLGIVMLVRTAALGGHGVQVGYIFGAGLIAVAVARVALLGIRGKK
jgi:hypothetical protein